MAVGCVPVDECIIQLKFKHEIPETILDSRAIFISTISARRKYAQGIGGASIHGVKDRKCGRFGGLMIWRKGGFKNFWLVWHQRDASRVHALSGF